MTYENIECIPYFCTYVSGKPGLKLLDSIENSLVCICTIDTNCAYDEYVINIYSPNDNFVLKNLVENKILFPPHRYTRFSGNLYPVCRKFSN